MTRFHDKEAAVIYNYNIHTCKVSENYWEVRTIGTEKLIGVFHNYEDLATFYRSIYSLSNSVFGTQLESPGFDFKYTEEELKKHPKFCDVVKELLKKERSKK